MFQAVLTELAGWWEALSEPATVRAILWRLTVVAVWTAFGAVGVLLTDSALLVVLVALGVALVDTLVGLRIRGNV